jgi:acyl-coenzyme A synthetase/AMP-(fatty) acid ligase
LMVQAKLAANAYPPEIEFVTTLPRTASGKQQSAVPRET